MTPALAEPPTEEQPALSAPDALPPAQTAERFADLAAAVRQHESRAGHRAVPKRPADHALYRLLTELERSD
jgi:hypothetical protein